ncbi:hypothetical protein DGG96_03615 [Legionella qingyii]|uniref:Uncharacterized protein n=1 Tax=Legionella qingyii TaxID=2184757 RepID=A0A317U850_9GAMM|nr:hypothetical protein DGG96_03615 [Legionella qingyii]
MTSDKIIVSGAVVVKVPLVISKIDVVPYSLIRLIQEKVFGPTNVHEDTLEDYPTGRVHEVILTTVVTYLGKLNFENSTEEGPKTVILVS